MQITRSLVLTMDGARPVIDLQVFDNDDQRVVVNFCDGIIGGISVPRIVGMTPEEAEDVAAALCEAAHLARENGLKVESEVKA